MRLEIKLIQVDNLFKALVLDMGQTDNRLQALFEGDSLEYVSLQANLYIESRGAMLWH